jgi:hypothetical protein
MDLDKVQACWVYCNLVKDMNDDNIIAYYGIDKKRTRLHDELCTLFKLEKQITKKYTDNLDKIKFNGTELYLLLLKEKNLKEVDS